MIRSARRLLFAFGTVSLLALAIAGCETKQNEGQTNTAMTPQQKAALAQHKQKEDAVK